MYALVFIGRSGEAFPAGVEIYAIVPALEPLDETVVDRDLWAMLRWMIDGVGGDWKVVRISKQQDGSIGYRRRWHDLRAPITEPCCCPVKQTQEKPRSEPPLHYTWSQRRWAAASDERFHAARGKSALACAELQAPYVARAGVKVV